MATDDTQAKARDEAIARLVDQLSDTEMAVLESALARVVSLPAGSAERAGTLAELQGTLSLRH